MYQTYKNIYFKLLFKIVAALNKWKNQKNNPDLFKSLSPLDSHSKFRRIC